MKEKWIDEELDSIESEYLAKALQWLKLGDMDSTYRYLATAIQLKELRKERIK